MLKIFFTYYYYYYYYCYIVLHYCYIFRDCYFLHHFINIEMSNNEHSISYLQNLNSPLCSILKKYLPRVDYLFTISKSPLTDNRLLLLRSKSISFILSCSREIDRVSIATKRRIFQIFHTRLF